MIFVFELSRLLIYTYTEHAKPCLHIYAHGSKHHRFTSAEISPFSFVCWAAPSFSLSIVFSLFFRLIFPLWSGSHCIFVFLKRRFPPLTSFAHTFPPLFSGERLSPSSFEHHSITAVSITSLLDQAQLFFRAVWKLVFWGKSQLLGIKENLKGEWKIMYYGLY